MVFLCDYPNQKITKMNQSISLLWVFLILLFSWVGYKLIFFHRHKIPFVQNKRAIEAEGLEFVGYSVEEWILAFVRALGQTWYILLALIVLTYLMLGTVVGKNILVYVDATLRDTPSDYWWENLMVAFLKYAFTLLSLLAFALSNWLTPQNFGNDSLSEGIWKQNLKINVYRYESAMVFVLMTLFVNQARVEEYPGEWGFTLWIVALNALFIVLLAVSIPIYLNLNGKSPRNHRRWSGWIAAAGVVLVVASIGMGAPSKFTRVIIQVHILVMGLWFWILTWPPKEEVKIKLVKAAVNLPNMLPEVPNFWRWLLLAVLYCVAIMYVFIPNVMSFPPLATLLFGLAFITFNLDALHFSYQQASFLGLAGERARLAVLMVSGLLVFLIFFQTTPSSVTLTDGQHTLSERKSFDEAFVQFITNRESEMSSDSIYPVYILTGQGGGSRAGFWMSQALIDLDLVPGLKFRQHCFALSTVSGSSAGAAAVLSLWDAALRDSAICQDSFGRFPADVFGGNYVTNGLSGLFFSAPASKVNLCGAIPVMDRNHRLQREESYMVARAIQIYKQIGRAPSMWFDIFSSARRFDSIYAHNRHFLDFYVRRDPSPDKQLPYFFPNTCHVRSGKRAVVSPLEPGIEGKESVFTQAFDFLANSSVAERGPTLASVANVSELFPGFSMAATNLKNESYVDGGYYENYGITTGLDIYRRCKHLLSDTCSGIPDSLRVKVRLMLIAVNNDPGSSGSTRSDKKVNQWLAPVSAMFNTRFGGQAEYMRAIARIELGRQYVEINTDDSNDVPLTRVLTRSNMNKLRGMMRTAIDSLKPQIQGR